MARNNSGVLAGLLACVLAVLGIVSLGFVFVPIAAAVALVGTVLALAGGSFAGVGVNLLAWVLTVAGFLSSPVLIGIAAALAVALLGERVVQ